MKKGNKLFLVVLFGLLSLIFLINFVSAYGLDPIMIKQGSQTIVDFFVNWAQPFLQAILGGDNYTGQLLFEKVLLFILFFSFIWVSLSRVKAFKDQKPGKVIIGFVIGVLAIRYMDFAWINTIITQYQVLGIAVTSFIPFIVYFFFINGIFPDNPVPRKIGWILFICIYFGLYLTTDVDTYSSVYFWTGIVAFVFLLLDGTIQKMLMMAQIKSGDREVIVSALANIGEEIEKLEKPSSGVPERYRKEQLEKLYRRRKDLQKML